MSDNSQHDGEQSEWALYTKSVPTDTISIEQYRAERDDYVRQVNVTDAVVRSCALMSVDGPDGAIPVRVYHPVTDGANLPVMLYLHGGGWTVGGGDALDGTYRAYCEATGCIVVTPDYRLAPENRFPAAYIDCWAVASWLAQHARDLGGDPGKITLAGESAGGNLAAALAATAIKEQGVRFQSQILIYPVLDLGGETQSYREARDPVTRDKLEWYRRNYISGPADIANPLASPLRGTDFAGLPRTIVIVGDEDPSLDECIAYAEALERAAVPVDLHVFEGWKHGFAFWPSTPAYQQMMDVVVAAVDSAGGHPPVAIQADPQ